MLESLGFDATFKSHSADSINSGFTVARIIEVNKNSYLVSDGIHEIVAEISGKFMFDASDATEYPTTGDWVAVQIFDNNTFAIIHKVLPRKTVLKRKEPGKRVGFQLIAANIDYGLVVQSAADCNYNLLDRYFVMLHECGIKPVSVFTKIDLLSQTELEKFKNTLPQSNNDYLLISNNTSQGVEELTKRLVPGKTYCLLGQSGVGKTSILNSLLNTNEFMVNEIREKDGKGRHTTVSRQLIRLDSGSLFIDTPGIRELGNFGIESGLDQTFEFSDLASSCRFRDCTHVHEAGCAIIEAVRNGEIEERRYQNYLKMRKESDFFEMSYLERRKKEKKFGRMVKDYQKRKGRE